MMDLMKTAAEVQLVEDTKAVLACNEESEHFGLALSSEDALAVMEARNESLKKHQRVEIGPCVTKKIIHLFCDSQYIWQDNYVETLKRLQDIFFLYKNECDDLVSDDELLTFMQEQFEGVCFGDLDYLETTCLQRFCMAIQAGYRGYRQSGSHSEYSLFDEEPRWDKALYMQVLRELAWE